jgi:hypothetical protein
MAMTMKNAVFWDVASCRSCVNRRFTIERRTSVSMTLKSPTYAGPSLEDFSPLKMEAIRSSETSVHTRSTRRNIPEESILLLRFPQGILLYKIMFNAF